MNTFAALGEYAPRPCSESEATAFAQAAMTPGTTLTLLPYNPAPLQSDEIRIDVTHCGVCHGDVSFASLAFHDHIYFPLVPGHEIVGTVSSLGDSVQGFEVGDRVSFGCNRKCCGKTSECNLCASGRENLCLQREFTFSPSFGGFSTSFQARAKFFVQVPEEIKSEHAAPLMCAGLTTFGPLARHTRPGMKVGVQGIGGLGHLGLQFAAHMGCEVTALSTSPSKQSLASSFGAHHFHNTADLHEKQRHRNSLDFLLMTANSFKVSDYIDYVKPGGAMCIVGIPPSKDGLGVDPSFIIYGKSLFGSVSGSMRETKEMMDFCLLHDIRPTVEVMPFEQAQVAFDMLATGTPRTPLFRSVLEMGSFNQAHRH